MTSSRVDVTAALVYERKPRYPVPSDLLPPLMPVMRPQALEDILFGMERTYPGTDMKNSGVLDAFEDLYALSAMIESD